HPDRGRFRYWVVFTPGVVEPARAERLNGGAPPRGQHSWGDFKTMIATLERGLEPGPWLLGEQFTAADVLVGSSVNFMRMFGVLPDSKLLNAYVDRCIERPAFQRAMQREQQAGG
ncbi:MAG: glutathione S-transferase C-terminal domain-containing protein, partial [Xanthomonadales bacterium]|nr:glutathione S-transferase C-terminal domain-containing protein [Xanthomonadales bacterium]